ncbi:cell adhesion molecule Dscam1-like, partial [Tachypleus tridentatus]|uniref:cell adhesion molecule Dscam1-like n=1 Tax=Tachypleus tridentatus TaxID=6853 RepID=UPI003FCF342F
PLDPPTLRVVTSTTTSVYLNWEPKESDNSIEYYLLYRSTEHNWEEIQSPGNKKSYIFHGLRCGTRYQFYIVAHNSAGKGTPSDIISAKTYGTVIHLTAWWSGGCPILHFVIQYKQSDSQEWVLFSNNILPDQKSISITDLLPATWYTLLMTATNEAGSTEAEYLWATLTSTGATLTPKSSPAASTKEFYRHLKIVIPVVCTTVVLVLVLTTTCLILIRRRHGVPSNRTYSPGIVFGLSIFTVTQQTLTPIMYSTLNF